MRWTPKEEKVAKANPNTDPNPNPNPNSNPNPNPTPNPNQVAKEVGSKSKDACKKHAKEI